MPERTCEFDGCEGTHWGRGKCKRHYEQWIRKVRKDPLAHAALMEEKRLAVEARRAADLLPEKVCTNCHRTQPRSEFSSMPRTRDGLHSWCKACLRDLAKANYDPEAARAKHERMKADPAYRAMKKAAFDAWRTANPEKMAAATQRWREANPEAVALSRRASGQRRRAERFGPVDDPLKTADYRAILGEYGMVCHICDGLIESMDDLHFDHVIPLSRGGLHVVENVRPAHGVCNIRKGNKIA